MPACREGERTEPFSFACAFHFYLTGGWCFRGISKIGGVAFGGFMPLAREGKHAAPFSFALPRGSTIGQGGGTTISSQGRSPKQPLPGMRLHDPLRGRQACPEFIAFDQGVGQICPR